MLSLLGYIRQAIVPRFWPAFLALAIGAIVTSVLHAQAMDSIEQVKSVSLSAYEAGKAERERDKEAIAEQLAKQNELLTQIQVDIGEIRGYLSKER